MHCICILHIAELSMCNCLKYEFDLKKFFIFYFIMQHISSYQYWVFNNNNKYYLYSILEHIRTFSVQQQQNNGTVRSLEVVSVYVCFLSSTFCTSCKWCVWFVVKSMNNFVVGCMQITTALLQRANRRGENDGILCGSFLIPE